MPGAKFCSDQCKIWFGLQWNKISNPGARSMALLLEVCICLCFILFYSNYISSFWYMHVLCWAIYSSDPFYYHGLTLIPIWISNYIHHKVWDEIVYPFPNFYCCYHCSFEMDNYLLHWKCDNVSMLRFKLSRVNEKVYRIAHWHQDSDMVVPVPTN